ncbi:MAG: hypothetical protein Q8888_00670 [Vigna little leaf phytoplasma]|nr:hypothetical protein [Vigna little leaf phytoplasma]
MFIIYTPIYVIKIFGSENEIQNQIVNNYNEKIFQNKPISQHRKDNNKIKKIYEYDIKGQLLQKKDIENDKTYTYLYNKEDQLLAKKIQKNNSFNFNYDNFHISDIFETYEYNNNNQLIIVRDNENKIKYQYKYDQKGRIISKIQFCLVNSPFFYKKIYDYYYNEQNQKSSKIYTQIQRPHPIFKFINKSTKINQQITTYEYNEKGQKIKKTDHINNQIYTYKYPN